jgi:hypothetical protein
MARVFFRDQLVWCPASSRHKFELSSLAKQRICWVR